MYLKISQVVELKPLYDKIKVKSGGPIKTVYKFTKLFNSINTEFDFYSNHIGEILNKYGLRDEAGNLKPTENGQGVLIQPDKINEASQEVNELMDLQVEIPDIIFTLDELENLGLTVEELTTLMPFIQE